MVGAHRLSDDIIVVANNGTRELKYFDARAQLIRTVAGQGEGPGEVKGISFTVSCGTDSVYVWDYALARLTVFSKEGEYVRAVTLRTEDGNPPSGRGSCNDGMLLMQREHIPLFREGPYRIRVNLVVFDIDGNLLHTTGEFPGSEHYYVVDTPSVMDRPLGKRTVYAVGDDRLYIGTADNYELRILALHGTTERLIRLERTDLNITQSHIDRYIATLVDAIQGRARRRSSERFWRNLTFPTKFPAFANLLLDRQHNIWLRDFDKPGDTVRTWIVFARTGELLARLTVPREFQVYEIGSDYVLGKIRDDVDVERVQLYALER